MPTIVKVVWASVVPSLQWQDSTPALLAFYSLLWGR